LAQAARSALSIAMWAVLFVAAGAVVPFLPGGAPPRKLDDAKDAKASPTPAPTAPPTNAPTPAPTAAPTPATLTCEGQQSEMKTCNQEACYVAPKCAAVDGMWGDWGEWSDCHCTGISERHREVLVHMECGGAPLKGPTSELKGCEIECDETFPVDCKFAEWGEWSFCDKDCGVGQQFRERMVESAAINCGKACKGETKETKECNVHRCYVANDCLPTDWEDWTPCSVTCDGGQQMRSRKILRQATGEGAGCDFDLEETRPCHETCCDGIQQFDCKFAEWQDWGACSASCDGGTRMRQRHLAQLPHHGGKKCEDTDMAETEPCGQRACNPIEPTDAVWGQWGDWSVDGTIESAFCTVSCGGGFQQRVRSIAVQAADGGQPANGPESEFQKCAEDECPSEAQNCEFSFWTEWGDCSAPVNGVRSRTRSIAVYSRKGGLPCEGPLREYNACNVDVILSPTQTLLLTDWTEWTECTVSCDGGSRQRSRSVTQPGIGDKGPLAELESCNQMLCCPECDENADCIWEDWSDWGACSSSCGGGEKKRSRNVAQLSKNLGKPCASQDSYEVAGCSLESCGGGAMQYCTWSDWSPFTECSAPCGGGTMERTRRLETSGYEPSDGAYLAAMSLAQQEMAQLTASLAWKNQALVGVSGAVVAMISLLAMRRRTSVAPAAGPGEALLE